MEFEFNMFKKYKYELMLLTVAAIWGFGFVSGKMCVSSLAPIATMGWRFGGSSIGLFLIFRKRIMQASKRTIKYACIIGFTQFVAQDVELIGLQYTTSAKSSFLVTSYVVMVPFVSWIILRKRPGAKAFLCGAMTLVGVGFICLRGDLSVGIGDIISLASAVGFAVQVVLISKFMNKVEDGIQFAFFQVLVATICSLTVCFVSGVDMMSFTVESGIGVAYLITINTMIGFIFQSIGQKHVSDVKASVLLSLESVFGFFFSILYYGGALGWKIYLGSLICFVSVYISSAGKKQN